MISAHRQTHRVFHFSIRISPAADLPLPLGTHSLLTLAATASSVLVAVFSYCTWLAAWRSCLSIALCCCGLRGWLSIVCFVFTTNQDQGKCSHMDDRREVPWRCAGTGYVRKEPTMSVFGPSWKVTPRTGSEIVMRAVSLSQLLSLLSRIRIATHHCFHEI